MGLRLLTKLVRLCSRQLLWGIFLDYAPSCFVIAVHSTLVLRTQFTPDFLHSVNPRPTNFVRPSPRVVGWYLASIWTAMDPHFATMQPICWNSGGEVLAGLFGPAFDFSHDTPCPRSSGQNALFAFFQPVCAGTHCCIACCVGTFRDGTS